MKNRSAGLYSSRTQLRRRYRHGARGKRKYSHTACAMISAGKRWRRYSGSRTIFDMRLGSQILVSLRLTLQCPPAEHPASIRRMQRPSFPQTLGHGNGPTETAAAKCPQSAEKSPVPPSAWPDLPTSHGNRDTIPKRAEVAREAWTEWWGPEDVWKTSKINRLEIGGIAQHSNLFQCFSMFLSHLQRSIPPSQPNERLAQRSSRIAKGKSRRFCGPYEKVAVAFEKPS